MRNVFDQYRHPENRLTHALVSSLEADRRLLRRFVAWVTGSADTVPRNLEIVEQQLPGEEEARDEQEAERRGLPDAWIHDDDTWALIIESKIQAPLTKGQLDRHRRTAELRGFSDVNLVAFVSQRPRLPVSDRVKIVEWTKLYSWMRREVTSEWARRLTEYMEVLERKLVEEDYLKEGTITVFSGVPFGQDYPYNYHEAKRLIRLALTELRGRRDLRQDIWLNPGGKGRPAITGREGSSVWDLLPLARAQSAKNFTEYPHLSLGINRKHMDAGVTIPDGIRLEFRRNLLAGGKEEFLELFGEVHNNLRRSLAAVEGAAPHVEIVQRHFPSRRASPIIDAKLQFDLRTAFTGPKGWRESVKQQPQWLEAVYEALSGKRSNIQFTVGATFPYGRCRAVDTPMILDHVASVWLACRPLVQKALG
jgi:hypothetical protein